MELKDVQQTLISDYENFTVDVVNQGTIPAMIDSFSITPTLTAEQANYFEYSATYSDGTAIAEKQKANEEKDGKKADGEITPEDIEKATDEARLPSVEKESESGAKTIYACRRRI